MGWRIEYARSIWPVPGSRVKSPTRPSGPSTWRATWAPMPSQPQHEKMIEEMVVEQVESLLEGGADFILFETTRTRTAMEQIALAIATIARRAVRRFVCDSRPWRNRGRRVDRADARAACPEGTPRPVALGMNCGTGPSSLLTAVEKAVRLTDLPLVVMPNAGIPKEVDDRKIYLASPEYIATYAKRYVDLGVAAVGGCCGIGPDHMRQVVEAVKATSRAAVRPVLGNTEESDAPREPVALAERSRLGKRLADKQWITTVELLPPRGYDLTATIDKSKKLREQGVRRGGTSPTAPGPARESRR